MTQPEADPEAQVPACSLMAETEGRNRATSRFASGLHCLISPCLNDQRAQATRKVWPWLVLCRGTPHVCIAFVLKTRGREPAANMIHDH